jgi:hypothetical protein
VDVRDATLEPLGYQQITGLNTVKSLTVPAGARIAIVQAEDQPVRWRDDGSNPTASVGVRLVADEELIYAGKLAKLRFIETTASAKLNVAYYR